MENSFNFKCDICEAGIVNGRKFTVESAEWESEYKRRYGGIDEENICKECHSKIKNYVDMIRS